MQNHDPQDPYRAREQRPQTELERLAVEGERRHARLVDQTAREADRSADTNLAVAIGGHFGTPFLRAMRNVQYAALATVAIQLLLMALRIANREIAGSIAVTAAVIAFVLLFVRIFVPPKAPRSQCDAEAAWVRSLPFTMVGYFEGLIQEPSYLCTFDVVVEWAPGTHPPDHAVLLGVIRLVDLQAGALSFTGANTDTPGAGTGVRWRSGTISGNTNITVNGRAIFRNHRIVRYVHDLVARMLIPLHRDSPIARVTLTRQ